MSCCESVARHDDVLSWQADMILEERHETKEGPYNPYPKGVNSERRRVHENHVEIQEGRMSSFSWVLGTSCADGGGFCSRLDFYSAEFCI